MFTHPRIEPAIEPRTSMQMTCDLVNAIAATERDAIRQAAMLISVSEYIADHNGGVYRTVAAQLMLEAARRLDPDVVNAPAGLQ